MKVKELIAELQKYDPEAEVVLYGNGKHAPVNGVHQMFMDGVGCGGVLPVISSQREQVEPNDTLSQLLKVINDLDSK